MNIFNNSLNLEEQFKLFAAYFKQQAEAVVYQDTIGLGQEDSKLAEHGNRLLHEKELES